MLTEEEKNNALERLARLTELEREKLRQAREKLEEKDLSGDTESAKLIRMIEKNRDTVFFRDEMDNLYVRILDKGHLEIKSCSGMGVREWLQHEFWKRQHKPTTMETINNALMVLKAKTYSEGTKIPLHNRVAMVDGNVWYDLSDDLWRAVKITKEDWNIVDLPPIIFRRESHQDAQILPERGGDIKKIFDFVNIKDEDQKILFLVYLVSCFLPDFPHPVPYVYGDQGSAKTTLSRILKKLLDPSKLEPTSLTRKEEALVQTISHHWLCVFDNVSYIYPEISDSLCRAVTGGGFSKRKHYTNDEDYIYKFKRCIVLNGISLPKINPDLMERCILFNLQRIPEDEKQDEQTFYKNFEIACPGILGAIFTILSRALVIRQDIVISKLPRMADFAKWGCAIAVAMGYKQEDFLDAYYRNIRSQNREVLSESSLASAVIQLMDEVDEWFESSDSTLKKLREIVGDEIAREKGFPQSGSALSRQLNTLKVNFLNAGIKCTWENVKNRRMLRLEKIKDAEKSTDPDDVEVGSTGGPSNDLWGGY